MMLVIVTFFWGLSYVAMNIAMTGMDPFVLNTYRFLIGFLTVAVFFRKRLLTTNRKTLKSGIICGLLFTMVYNLTTFGVKYTTVSNAAFLAATPVIIIPIMEFIVFRKRPPKKIAAAVLICTVGVMFLTLTEDFSLNMSHLRGDIYSLLTGISYSAEIIYSGRAVSNDDVDAFNMGVIGLLVTGIATLVLSVIFGDPCFSTDPKVVIAVLFLSIFCTGVALVIQPIAQQYTEPSHVGIIYSLEPVFATITAFLVEHEVLTPRAYLGEVMILSSVILMELNFDKKKKGRGA